jgi:hypothetical protein
MSDQVICRMLIAKDRAELDTKIARAAALDRTAQTGEVA